jgi:hypothetical protein
VEVAHYGNGQTVYKRDPQHLGYQNEAASGNLLPWPLLPAP